jgi:hypothetical protein
MVEFKDGWLIKSITMDEMKACQFGFTNTKVQQQTFQIVDSNFACVSLLLLL